MTDITEIVATIRTGSGLGAQTDDWVYLGIAGREFLLNTAADDFEDGDTNVFVIGTGSNVTPANLNDPTSPQLTIADLDLFPVYLRLASNNEWLLDEATVTVNNTHVFENPALTGSAANQQIWLARNAGTMWYLRRTAGTPQPGPPSNSTLGGHVVRGTINENGTIHAGSGNFQISVVGAGQYRITFTTPFPAPPSATATIWGDWLYMQDAVHIAGIDQTGVTIFTSDSNFSRANRPFNFIAIG
ncbi:hypothetical protein AB0C51_07855 [Streptomyces pathocidini]|uniref:hypothetical protein n=1 Tax=Streptomyces pathocidini TaxID=1650571 RepID=UPI0033FFECAA